MDNSFDEINPFSFYFKFKMIISQIKDKNELMKILKLIENRLNEFKEDDN